MKRLGFLGVLLLFALQAAAQSYPVKPVRMIVPYPPGGGNDTLGRLFAAKLSERLGQPFVVENRPGAGTMIGTEAAAKSAPDGYTILLSSIATHALSPNLYSRVPYDPVKDFAPITLLGIAPTVLVVPADLPAKTLQELIAAAKAKPGALAYASGGNGTPPHINAEVFKSVAGIDLLHVAYKGGGPALVDLMAGRVQAMLDTAASAMPHVRSGKLRALAISAPRRSPELPDLPTFAEAGLPQYDTNAWYSMHAPGGHAAGHRAAAERRAGRDPQGPGDPRALQAARHRPGGQLAGGIRRLRARRARQVRAHHQGRRNKARLMKLLVLPGDGIGPEITAATLAVLEAADRKFKLGLAV